MKQCLNEKKKEYTLRLTLNLYLLQKRTVKSKCSCVNFLSIFFVFICRNYMNDSFRTEVFVRFQPETIACACIYLAARQLQVCSKYFFHYMHTILNFTLFRSFWQLAKWIIKLIVSTCMSQLIQILYSTDSIAKQSFMVFHLQCG